MGMSLSNNETPEFEYFKPTTVSDAVSLLNKYAGQAKVIAGGLDVLYLMRNYVQALVPTYVVDITGLGLNTITFSASDGLTIGGTTTISDVSQNSDVLANYPALAQATSGHPAGLGNQGTVAGNVLQEVWCWYLRNNYPSCWRNGGNLCYPAEGGDGRYYHSIFGGNLCYAVHPSDISTALFALDAKATVSGSSGQSTLTMDQLIPGVSIVEGRVTEKSLTHDQIVTEFHIPPPASGTTSAFYKVSERPPIDLALASAAVSAVISSSGTVSNSRIVLGAVANKPLRASSAESYINGKTLSADVISQAASLALKGATPLKGAIGASGWKYTTSDNSFRVFLAQTAVMRALRSIAPTTST